LALENDVEFGAAQIAINSLSCSGEVSALSALSAVNRCPATQAIANAGKKSAKSFALMSRLAGFSLENGPFRRVPGGVVFRKLSKLLNQEDA
jgi:hypothetical protein